MRPFISCFLFLFCFFFVFFLLLLLFYSVCRFPFYSILSSHDYILITRTMDPRISGLSLSSLSPFPLPLPLCFPWSLTQRNQSWKRRCGETSI
jgi:hypothetical protein